MEFLKENETLIQALAPLTPQKFTKLYENLKTDGQRKNALWARCATDIRLFARHFFPHYCTFAFNEFHKQIFRETKFREKAIRRARAAPRGYAKSTIKALIKPIHDICYGLEDFIVFISNTQDQANGKLRDIRSEVLVNDRLSNFYGLRFTRRNPGETSYELECAGHHAKLEAYGAGVEIRGIRFGASRPTKIVVDDAEHSEEVMSEDLRNKFSDWYFQVVSQIGNEKTNIEFIGTMLHRESLLAKLLKNPAYDGRLYKSVISWAERQDLWLKWQEIYTDLDNPLRLEESELFFKTNEAEMLKGTAVLWPEKEPYLWLMKEMVEKGRRNFMKEKQNEPIGGDERLFDRIWWYQERSDGLFIEATQTLVTWKEMEAEAYGAIDPSTGQSKAKKGKLGDYACLVSGFKDFKGRLFVHKDWTKRAAPTKQIEQIFDTHDVLKYQKVGVETNLYRNLMLPNILTERKRREKERKDRKIANYGIQIAFYDIEQTEKKEKRIYTLEPKVTHGHILFNRSLSADFMGMMEAFPFGDHDDGPDALEMLWSLVNDRYRAVDLEVDVMGGR